MLNHELKLGYNNMKMVDQTLVSKKAFETYTFDTPSDTDTRVGLPFTPSKQLAKRIHEAITPDEQHISFLKDLFLELDGDDSVRQLTFDEFYPMLKDDFEDYFYTFYELSSFKDGKALISNKSGDNFHPVVIDELNNNFHIDETKVNDIFKLLHDEMPGGVFGKNA